MLFPLSTGTVDNSVENFVQALSEPRPVGFRLVCFESRHSINLNKINRLEKRLRASSPYGAQRAECSDVCISQVLTAPFSDQHGEKTRRYWTASAIWLAFGVSVAARSAIVRATFNTR